MRFVLPLLLVLAGCSRPATSRGPLPHEIYVWQRQWTPAVRSGLDRAAPIAAGFDVLIGEVGMKDGEVRTALAQTDYPALVRAGKPVVLGLRIGTYSGQFTTDSRLLVAAKELLRTSLDRARAAGLHIAELQIDFDCPSTRLADYAAWMRDLRGTFPGQPMAITALPDWLKRKDFAMLAATAGRFVLQVHSIPTGRGAPPALCDIAMARRAITQAAKCDVPFRVALPTYSCALLIDSAGNVKGVRAEDDATTSEFGEVVLRANAAELSALVRDWEFSRPANLTGVIWYRLPIDTDRYNWRWPTLAAIIAGKTPRPEGRLVFQSAGDGVEDAVLENTGDADWPRPAELTLPKDTVAADGINGFRIGPTDDTPPKLQGRAGRILPPGGRLICGWVRRGSPLTSSSRLP